MPGSVSDILEFDLQEGMSSLERVLATECRSSIRAIYMICDCRAISPALRNSDFSRKVLIPRQDSLPE